MLGHRLRCAPPTYPKSQRGSRCHLDTPIGVVLRQIDESQFVNHYILVNTAMVVIRPRQPAVKHLPKLKAHLKRGIHTFKQTHFFESSHIPPCQCPCCTDTPNAGAQ